MARLRTPLIDGVHDGLDNSLFDPDGLTASLDRARACFGTVGSHVPDFPGLDEKSLTQALARFETISRRYLQLATRFERTSSKAIRKDMATIKKAASKLLTTIDAAVHKDQIFGLPQLHGIKLPGPMSELVEWLRALEQLRSPPPPKRGARPAEHVSTAIVQLAAQWESLTGAVLRRSYSMAEGRGGEKEFVDPGVADVFRLTRAIDPAIEPQTVVNALRSRDIVKP